MNQFNMIVCQVLNSGGQLQIQRPAPEPPNNRVNGSGGGQGGGQAVYQQPHQHNNGTYDTYMGGQRQETDEM